ncbi:hypothetical protein BpHYR1_007919 [Brachionus plicatilis]|uniref:Uncharacterized protein n=1 Tax=Brachionus plicatilis TaxID=10195 RepID=A0A3M7Q782_BRAPC|nr:hypothetical protein BpHYR1_007919 [Brachionus plicatilis]
MFLYQTEKNKSRFEITFQLISSFYTCQATFRIHLNLNDEQLKKERKGGKFKFRIKYNELNEFLSENKFNHELQRCLVSSTIGEKLKYILKKLHLLFIFKPKYLKGYGIVCASENPQVIAQVQRRCFSEKFRNFVDLCVLKNYEFRASTQQLLHHSYLKKMKLSSCLGTFQMSIVSDGLVELQKKIS